LVFKQLFTFSIACCIIVFFVFGFYNTNSTNKNINAYTVNFIHNGNTYVVAALNGLCALLQGYFISKDKQGFSIFNAVFESSEKIQIKKKISCPWFLRHK